VDSTHGKDFVLTDYAKKLIRFKARQLCRRRDFLTSDQDDLQQELWLMVCERADGFNPAKASLNTFIDRVVNSAVAQIVRNRERLKRGKGGHVVSLDGEDSHRARPSPMSSGLSPEHLYRRIGVYPADPITVRETAEAVQAVLMRMPEDLREICLCLMNGTANSVACDMHISRRALRKACLVIREFLERAGLENG
jgi:RNA polymerase sigma factor (sigma-70 family)